MHLLRTLIVALLLTAGSAAKAGIPVIDAANLVNTLQQVIAWGEQYKQMIDQIKQAKESYEQMIKSYDQQIKEYKSIFGVRNMGDLANNAAARHYLPKEWMDAAKLMSGSEFDKLKGATQILSLSQTGFSGSGARAQAFLASQSQVVLNRAMSEQVFKKAGERISAIQSLIDKVNDVPDQKDALDLQARVSAETAMLQNDLAQQQGLAMLQQAQRDILNQQARELAMTSTHRPGGVVRFGVPGL